MDRMWGVGRVTERKLHAAGIRTIGDLAQADPEPKSVSNETTFDEDTTDLGVLREQIQSLSPRVSERLRHRGLQARTVVLKLTYRNFEHVSRRATLPQITDNARTITVEAEKLLERSEAGARPVRLVGVGVTTLTASVVEARS